MNHKKNTEKHTTYKLAYKPNLVINTKIQKTHTYCFTIH